jgi:hypothetical protein
MGKQDGGLPAFIEQKLLSLQPEDTQVEVLKELFFFAYRAEQGSYRLSQIIPGRD